MLSPLVSFDVPAGSPAPVDLKFVGLLDFVRTDVTIVATTGRGSAFIGATAVGLRKSEACAMFGRAAAAGLNVFPSK